MANSKAQKRSASLDDKRAAVHVGNEKGAGGKVVRAAASPSVRRLRLDRAELGSTLGFRLREAWGSMERCFLDTFRAHGISPPLYAVLILVEANPGCLPSEICKEMGTSAANMVPYLDQLVARELILREAGVHDRRAKHLTITSAGSEYLKELRKLHRTVDEHFARKMGSDNMSRLVELLARMGNDLHGSPVDISDRSTRKS